MSAVIPAALFRNDAVNAEPRLVSHLADLGHHFRIRVQEVDQEIARANQLEGCFRIETQHAANAADFWRVTL